MISILGRVLGSVTLRSEVFTDDSSGWALLLLNGYMSILELRIFSAKALQASDRVL